MLIMGHYFNAVGVIGDARKTLKAFVIISFLTGILNFVAPLCESTGPDCIDHCDVTHNGVYQWCARCDYFLLCSGSEEFYMECQPGLSYDHTVEACVYNSTTCCQCYDGSGSTTSKYELQLRRVSIDWNVSFNMAKLSFNLLLASYIPSSIQSHRSTQFSLKTNAAPPFRRLATTI